MEISKRAKMGVIKKIDDWREIAIAIGDTEIEIRIKCKSQDLNKKGGKTK